MGLIKLLDGETSGFFMSIGPTTIASFYVVDNTAEGATNTIDSLRNRAGQILKANPWLCGRLVRKKVDGKKDVFLSYDDEPGDLHNYVYVIISDALFDDKLNNSGIVLNYVPKKGSLCVDKDEPLCKFLIFQNSDITQLALVFSLHHVIGDGYTLYYLWRMLDEKEEVSTMVVERDHNFMDHIKRDTNLLLRMQPMKYFLAFLFHAVGRWIRRTAPPHTNMYKVDVEAISRMKARYNTPDSFVSTNDILNCIFFGDKGCQSDGIIMVINMRGRIPEIHKNMAGNYQQGCYLRTPDVCNPQVFREAWTGILSKGQAQREPLSFSDLLKHGMLNLSSNWATDYYQVELTGFKHSLHMPVLKVPGDDTPAGPMRHVMIIFKMNCDAIGVYTSVYSDLRQDHFDDCEVFCGKVL